VGWAGFFFILHWNLTDLLSLPAEGYWYPGYQISIIIQGVLGILLLPSRAILPFLIFQLTTIGMWGNWLDINYYDPPLLSSGQPVTAFWTTFTTLAAQESIILFIVRYLRLQMEKSLRLQQNSIVELEKEVAERQHVEARLLGVFDNSPDLVMEIDRDGTILFANHNAREYEGSQAQQFTLPEYHALIHETISQAFKTGENISLELKTAEGDGSFQWNSIRVGPVLSGDHVTSLVAVISNIHAQKTAELQIKQRAEQLAMLDEIGRAVAEVTDLKTVLELIRQQLEKLLEFDSYSVRIFNETRRTVTYLAVNENGRYWDEPEAALEPGTHSYRVFETGESILHLMTEEELEKYRRGLYTPIGDHSKTTASLIFVPLKKQGKTIGTLSLQRYEPNSYTLDHLHLVEAVAIQVAIAIENARLFESLQRELQERTRAEEIREKLIGELEQKNAELERFTYTVSHDLRSPLVTIKGFVGMLNKDMQDHRPDRVESDLHRIAGAADKMDALLSDLLELSRIGRLVNPPEEVDTVKLIQDALDSVNAQLRAKNVTVNILPGLPKLHGDRIRLREVFENLIGNAAKYMGNQTDPLIEIGVREREDEKVFYVKDNGMGIDPQYHARIFNLFEKLNPAIEGTGIGLAIVKRIIEVHGGRVWAESEGIGKGSTFCFTIPAAGNETRLN
jgi:PAS domain S-box-containing protein